MYITRQIVNWNKVKRGWCIYYGADYVWLTVGQSRSVELEPLSGLRFIGYLLSIHRYTDDHCFVKLSVFMGEMFMSIFWLITKRLFLQ